ncbi:MAG: DUF6175 family protein [Rikenellaceae bacterium]
MVTTPKKKVGRLRKVIPKPTDIVKHKTRSSNHSLKGGWLKYLIGAVVIIVGGIMFKNQIFNGGHSLTNVSFREIGNGAMINTLNQTKQTIMVIPSDNMLQKNGALKTSQSMGKTLYSRDYQAFMLSGDYHKQVITTIQRSFSDSGYPLVDLEQSLKSLENQSALDAADGLAKDAKTLLLTTARPDIIIEFDYDISTKMVSREESNTQLSYNIVLLDAFSNKSIGSINNPGVAIESNNINNVSVLLNQEIKNNLSQLSTQIKSYFSDILTNGREITFTVSLQNGAAINLQDMYNTDGDSYGDWIRNWVRQNAKMGAATMQRNTTSEMHFVDVRIENLQEDGQQFNAYDFADKFRKEFYSIFQIQVVNNSQGLATSHIVIK